MDFLNKSGAGYNYFRNKNIFFILVDFLNRSGAVYNYFRNKNNFSFWWIFKINLGLSITILGIKITFQSGGFLHACK